MKYYQVTARGGHVGKNHFIPVDFFIEANSAKEAANICRWLPRVKHDHKFAILKVSEISKSNYISGILLKERDPYFFSSCVQEQRLYFDEIYLRVQEEPQNTRYHNKRHSLRRTFNNYDIKNELMLY